MNDLIYRLRSRHESLSIGGPLLDIDCQDAAKALEQALDLLQRAVDSKRTWQWVTEAEQWINTYKPTEPASSD